MNKVIMVIGPTAVGKSSLGVKIAKKYHSEIISADSIQVYRKLDIGSGKITTKEMDGIKHHLIDILDPYENYNVYMYQNMARNIAKKLHQENKIPIVVGGTGLYSKAMVYNYDLKIENDDYDYKEELEKLSNEELYDMLRDLDPNYLDKVHLNNRKRVIRAIISAKQGNLKSNAINNNLLYDTFFIGLTSDRSWLYQNAEKRIDKMIKDGLEKEISSLLEVYPNLFSYQSTQGIGYKEWKGYFENSLTLDETIDLIKKNTRHFIKRQFTWINNQFPACYYDVNNKEEMDDLWEKLDQWIG